MSDRIPTAKQIEELAENYLRNEVLCCQSSLVDELLKLASAAESRSDLSNAFCFDNIENIYCDPSDWDLRACNDYLRNENIDWPDSCPRPWKLDRDQLTELLTDVSIDVQPHEELPTLLAAVIANIDDGTIDGLSELRDHIRDEAIPAEPLEWWAVSQWLAEELRQIGQPVLDNDYGYWWGRTCSGQMILCDGTLQEIANRVLHR